MADETLRTVHLTQMGEGRWKATNRRGGVLPIGSGDDPDFSPVELLLAAIAGCSAIDVDLITGKRAAAESFDLVSEGDKIRDDQGNRMTNLRVTFDMRFPEGEAGDRAREVLPRAIAMSRDRLCTVSRTVAVESPVDMGPGSGTT
ncbi:MAG: OsmC family protein [Marmoricola sp.]